MQLGASLNRLKVSVQFVKTNNYCGRSENAGFLCFIQEREIVSIG